MTPQTQQLTAQQYLDQTRAGLAGAIHGLSPEQWNFKPAPDRWSVAENVEHLAIIENYFVATVGPQLVDAPSAAPAGDAENRDAEILARVPDRSTKYQGPPEIHPTGRWSPQETLERYLASRRQTAEFLNSGLDLRAHSAPHRVLGVLDGYQWVLTIAAHTDRHIQQIEEVKAHPDFPAN